MNERIRELSDQATQEFSPAFDRDKWQDKFAELIVRECMTQIQQVREIKAGHAGPEYTHGFDDGMFVAIRTIEEHFGVEE